GDEPPRLVALAFSDHGDAVEDEGVKALGDLETVGWAKRAETKRVEIESRDTVDRLWLVEIAAEQFDFQLRAPLMAGQSEERLIERGVRLGAYRRVIDWRPLELFEPIVRARVEFDHVKPFLQEGDEGQEQSAIEAVLVKVVGRDVRRRHDDHARREQSGKQPPQDHRIGDVADRKLVEADERRLARELRRDR